MLGSQGQFFMYYSGKDFKWLLKKSFIYIIMSSVIRSYGLVKEGLTRFIKPESPTYDDGTNDVLFPFSYSNGVLDISYSGNSFKTIMVDVVNVDPISETDTAVRIMSGPYLATQLGNNFKAYIRAWRDGTIDAGSPIEVNIPAQLLRVQEVSYLNLTANSSESYKITTQAPASDTYPMGTVANNYETKYIFKTPLTFTIMEGGVKQYITFRTVLDQE